jgi:hypothetical protein
VILEPLTQLTALADSDNEAWLGLLRAVRDADVLPESCCVRSTREVTPRTVRNDGRYRSLLELGPARHLPLSMRRSFPPSFPIGPAVVTRGVPISADGRPESWC